MHARNPTAQPTTAPAVTRSAGRPALRPAAREALGWRWHAACAAPGVDPALFYSPDRPETPPERARRLAAACAVCNRCPVAAECLADALATRDRWAVRAGLTYAQRGRLARKAAAKGAV